MQDVKGKVAFVTGGASGIGLGITKALLKSGAQVAIGDIREDHLEHARSELFDMGFGNVVMTQLVDVTDRDSLAEAADAVEAHFGKVHILCSNAGVGLEGPLDKATFADWDFGIAVNLMGPINGMQIFAPRIAAHHEGGHIVNTASLAGMVSMPSHMAIYATAKSAVIAFSEAIRDGLAEKGIGVSVLCPGPIKSNIHQASQNRPAKFRQGSGFRESEERLGQRQVSDLWMEPEQVGDMVLDAILNDKLYVITHGEWRPAVIARHEAILAAMPTDINPDLIASLRPPTSDAEE